MTHDWRQAARDARSELKSLCLKDDLSKLQRNIQSVSQWDNETILCNGATAPEIVKITDAGALLSLQTSLTS